MSVGPIGLTELSGIAYRGDPNISRKKISHCDMPYRITIDATMTKPTNRVDVTLGDYRALAEFRYELRRDRPLTVHAARSAGRDQGQYRLILMLKGVPVGIEATIGNLAERLG